MAPEPQRWAGEAALNSLLKYAPQKAGLSALIHAAQQQFNQSVVAGRSEGLQATQAAQKAAPEVKGIYDRAQQQGQSANALTGPILAALQPGNPFATAAALNNASGEQRLGAERAHAESDVAAQGSAAAAIPAFTRQSALAKLAQEMSKLREKGSLLEGSEAADTQSEIGKLRHEAEGRATTERGQNMTSATAAAGHAVTERGQNITQSDSAAGRRTTERGQNLAHPPGGAAEKPATGAEHNAAAATISQIKSLLGKQPGFSRAEYVAKLSAGQPEQTVERNGQKQKTPAVPAYAPNGVMAAALDWAQYGGLTPHTENRLSGEGFNVARLMHSTGMPRAGRMPGVRGAVSAGG